jgi:hypothetical protein
MDCWPDPEIDFAGIAELLPGNHSAGAVKHRGYKIGLGRKARLNDPNDPAKNLTPWPDDMPDFDDHPHAAAPGSRTKAIRSGARFRSITKDAKSSPAGSSLEGGAFHPTGRRV